MSMRENERAMPAGDFVSSRRAPAGPRRRGERGQAATEYILLIGVVVLPIVVGYRGFIEAIRNVLTRVVQLLAGPGI
jgi:Flp pilus assembly pilin Flp